MLRPTSAGMAVVAFLLVAACGQAPQPQEIIPVLRPRPGTIDALLGPWQATPLRLDAAFRARVVTACRREIEFGAGGIPAVIDARGAAVVTVRMIGPQQAGSCNALEVLPADITGAGGGWYRNDGNPRVAPLADSAIGQVEVQTVEGGQLTVRGWSVYGRAGGDIATVVIQPAEHAAVLATFENGWFSAWWPAALPQQQDASPPEAAHFTVRGYDAGGVLRAEYAQ